MNNATAGLPADGPAVVAGVPLPPGLDARTLLPELWDHALPDPGEDEEDTAELLGPYSRAFPGLASATTEEAGPGQLSAAVESLTGPLRIGLVAAARPADALSAMAGKAR
jgi:hypothetical protein